MKSSNNPIKKSIWQHLLLLLFLLTAIGVFAAIVVEVLWEKEGYIDSASFSLLHGFISPGLTKAMTIISLLASSYFLLPAYIILIVWHIVKKQKFTALYIGLIGITSFLVVYLLKHYFQRARPGDPLDGMSATYSFPSGHSSSAFIFYGLLIYLVWKNNLQRKYKIVLSIFFGLLALLIAFSRVYLHRHFASDVLAGFCVGAVWLSVSFWSMNRVLKK